MGSTALRRVTLRNIATHKLRLVLSVVAVVLGVAFVTGSFAFTATLKGAFDGIIDKGTTGLSAHVSSAEKHSPGVALSDVDTIRALPGVARVVPAVEESVVLLNSEGKPYQTGGAPMRGTAWTPSGQQIGQADTITGGREPAVVGEIALTGAVIRKAGLTLGGPAKIYTTSKGVVDTTIVGEYSNGADVGGYVGVAFSPEQARALFTDGEHVHSISVAADDGVSQQEVRERIAGALPGAKVVTGDEFREEQSKQLSTMLDFINYFFVAFGCVALLVGTFIIYNTFAMLVAQRLRELGLLRAIGASRGQVTRSVLGEAVVIGLVGSLLGVLAGFALAKGILFALDRFGFGLPSSGLTITATSIVTPLGLGLVVTLVSAVMPALRAGRIPPVVALRTTSGTGGGGSIVTRSVIGGYLTVLGAVLAYIGTLQSETKPGAITVGIGAGILILGAFLVMPAMARPIAGGIGRVLGLPFGAVGRLASTNAGRNSRRTAATAFALTLGLTLVAAFGTLAASTKASLSDAVSQGITADFIVRGVENQGPPTPLPTDLPSRLDGVDGVREVVSYSVGFARVGGENTSVSSVRGRLSEVVDPGLVEGSLDPGPNSAVVSREVARSKGWVIGTPIPVESLTGEKFDLTVTGVYSNSQLIGKWYTGADVYERVVPENLRSVAMVFVADDPGADTEHVRAGLEDAAAVVPIATVSDRQQFVDQSTGGIDQMLTIIYALLGLALVVAVLGIVNTLALSVIERRSEIGMLRAVGMQRSQVRRTINLESTQIAVFGAVVGAAIGVFLGWAFVSVLAEQGLKVVSIPWGTIGIVLVCSAVVGVLASLCPAHSASRTSPLEAIAD